MTNQPGGNGEVPEVANRRGANETATPPSNSRRQATRNYELDRTISYTKHQMGKLRRLTVAVVVDDRLMVGAGGTVESSPWSENELERLSILVRDTVGFSAVRGDSVNVLNSPFVGREEAEIAEQPLWEQSWFLALAKQLAGVLIILALILGLLRPVLKSLTVAGLKAKEAEEAKEMAALEEAGLNAFDNLSDETVTLTGGESLALPSPEESYEQQLNAVKGLIAEDPGRVAQVIKGWINEDG